MNAPVNPKEAYVPIVHAHMPWCTGRELSLRCSIMLMRDRATADLRRSGEVDGGVLEEIVRLAILFAYRRMPLEALEALRSEMVRLVGVARGLREFEAQLSGGQDARG